MLHAVFSGSWKPGDHGFETLPVVSEWPEGRQKALLRFQKGSRPAVCERGNLVRAPLPRGEGFRLLYAGTRMDDSVFQTMESYNSMTRNPNHLARFFKQANVLADHSFTVSGSAGVHFVSSARSNQEDAMLIFLGESGGGGRDGFVKIRHDLSTAVVLAKAEVSAPNQSACEAAVLMRPGQKFVTEWHQSFDSTETSRGGMTLYTYYGAAGVPSKDPRGKHVLLEAQKLS